jgi:hypothetical protein
MQADGRLPNNMKRNYKNGFDAITRIAKDEGVASLWRGSSPTVARAVVITASQLAVYDELKAFISSLEISVSMRGNTMDLLREGPTLHVAVSGIELCSCRSSHFNMCHTFLSTPFITLHVAMGDVSHRFVLLSLDVRCEESTLCNRCTHVSP